MQTPFACCASMRIPTILSQFLPFCSDSPVVSFMQTRRPPCPISITQHNLNHPLLSLLSILCHPLVYSLSHYLVRHHQNYPFPRSLSFILANPWCPPYSGS